MRRFTLLYLMVCCLWHHAVSNPIPTDPYSMIGITEVYIASQAEWYIELDGEWCLLYNNATAPCSVQVYLRIVPRASSSSPTDKKIYSAKVGFNSNGYGVISRSSLPTGSPVIINSTDTIMVTMDTVKRETPYNQTGEVEYWRFPLRPVGAGMSLVAFGQGFTTLPEFRATSRRSLGSAGYYNTRYVYTLVDNYGKPVPEVEYRSTGAFAWTDSNGILQASVSLFSQQQNIEFRDRSSAHSLDQAAIPPVTMHYDDADSVVYDTIEIALTSYKLEVKDEEGNPVSGIGCYRKFERTTSTEVITLYESVEPHHSDSTDYWLLRVYPSAAVVPFCFAAGHPSQGYTCVGEWIGAEVDTSAILDTTVVVTPTAIAHGYDKPGELSGVSFSVLPVSGREIRVVVTSPLSAARATAALYTVNGREVGAMPVTISGQGTSTSLFQFRTERLAPGTYLCNLKIEDYSPISRTFTIP